MNKEKDEEVDKLFRKGVEDPANEAVFRDEDWNAMEQMLHKGKNRPAIIYWLPMIGSAAALLLIFIGYLFLKPEVVKPTKKDQVAVTRKTNPHPQNNTDEQKKDNTGTSGEPARQAADNNKQQNSTSAKYAGTKGHLRHGQKSKSFFTLSSGAGRRNAAGYDVKNKTVQPAPELMATKGVTKNVTSDTSINKVAITSNIVADRVQSGAVADRTKLGTADDRTKLGTADDRTKLGTADAKKQKDNSGANTLASAHPGASLKAKSSERKKLGNRPQFALGVIASSDLNGVNSSFQQSKIGGNFGATFSITFAGKWTISTGAMYDIKPYLTSFDNYHTTYKFNTQPSSVYANCRMLDIPFNVNYQVYKKQANAITIGTGLSSYFMLREDYKFNYEDSYYASGATGPVTYTVINKNRNILSVLNLDATYTHQVNSKFGITVQPYLKIPLSDVGASQVRLQTTGVALGLSWNLNASPKLK